MKRGYTMDYRKFKNSLDISLLGFGTMRLPCDGGNLANINARKAYKMFDYAFEHGVNYFDTAHMYHGEASEPFGTTMIKGSPDTTTKL